MSNSANIPALGNKIVVDVPALNALLRQMIQAELANVTDLPERAKQMVEGPDGWEFQLFNGSGWATMADWNINAQKVDGHSAATDTTPNTIPVRGADGKIPGDILGNAATATTAEGLSETLDIANGGTGGTTAAQARQNLGVAPTNHASSGTDYGIGTESLYGHVKAHDAPDATKTAATGDAISPAGAAAMQDTLEGQINDLAGVVSANASAQSTRDSQQDAAISAAASAANNAQSSADAAQSSIAEEKQLLQGQISKAVPAGTVIAFAANKAPDGFLLCNGAAVSRTTYAALFSAIGTIYGAGDGSATFNLPNLTDRFIQGSGTAGMVKAAGLPNITGTFQGDKDVTGSEPTGVFYLTGTNVKGNAGGGNDKMIGFDASRSSAIYGASTTVQPPALTMRYYIKY